jgi:enediyne biosynthesis protein E4
MDGFVMRITLLTLVLSSVFGLLCCQKKGDSTSKNTSEAPLFTLLDAQTTGVQFRNDLVYDRDFNIYRYRNFYNGGGVAIGDVNNDGLPDLFFTANMTPNKLYINRGNLKFEDVSEQAGFGAQNGWSTGVSMADLNGDGYLDIYVSNSGNPRTEQKDNNTFSRENALFINQPDKMTNGVPRFVEQARTYGLADRGLTTHTAFFDYDRDGDLDAYVLNNSFRPIGSFDLRKNLRYSRDSLGGHKLLENTTFQRTKNNTIVATNNSGGTPRFRDVSQKAGILGSVIAFGLGVTVGDLDLDGWQDIYVSNDFFERDYLYRNRGDGTFHEELEQSMRHISAASMGADMADINNDARPDIFVTDMLPEPDYRIKTATSFDSPDRFKGTTAQGYYNQFTRNMLHLNNGTTFTPKPPAKGEQPPVRFSDIACMASCEATDWSWGALIFDMDNDGWKDIFVANGIAQDLTNQDYLMFASDPTIQQEIIAGGNVDYKRLIDSIPSEPQPSYAFSNQRDLTFTNKAADWGLAKPGFSNGSAYGDLDNDGDLDLVVNCVNDVARVYRNDSRQLHPDDHFLTLQLQGTAQNTAAFGARIFVRAGGQTLYQEQMPMRGFQSAMDPRPHFGLGKAAQIDTLLIEWPDGTATLQTAVPANQILSCKQVEANLKAWPDKAWLRPSGTAQFKDITVEMGVAWKHQESKFDDWDRDRLLFYKYSTEGPRIAIGDVNGDRMDDFYVGGAAGQPGALFIQRSDTKFSATEQPAFAADAACEDVDAVFFDCDFDGDLDLYVASGSNEFQPGANELNDRLYINDGKGRFERKTDALPPGPKPFASSVVRPADYDGDGDIDLFVGMRLLPGKYGVPVGGFLLQNSQRGHFTPVQPDVFKNMGLTTDATWADIDGDDDPDLVVCGEWMPVRVFKNDAGQFSEVTEALGLAQHTGLWKKLCPADFNKDNKPDFIVGNMGLNTRLDAAPGQPLTLFFNDFDRNGTSEQFLCRYNSGMLLPYTLRGDLVSNLPILKKKYLRFGAYKNQQMTDIFTKEQLNDAVRLEANILASVLLLSGPDGRYQVIPLPNEAQMAPIYGIAVGDFDADQRQDVLLGGNLLGAKPEFGFADAEYGLLLKGNGKGGFKPQRSAATGLHFEGEVRDIQPFWNGPRIVFAVARNNAPISFWTRILH